MSATDAPFNTVCIMNLAQKSGMCTVLLTDIKLNNEFNQEKMQACTYLNKPLGNSSMIVISVVYSDTFKTIIDFIPLIDGIKGDLIICFNVAKNSCSCFHVKTM